MGVSNIQKYQNESYFESLLKQCSKDKKRELINLLRLKIDKFSNGDSSISKVRAQSLMDSIVYILSIYLKQYDNQIGIEIIESQDIEDSYRDALLWMKHLMNIVMKEVEDIQSSMIEVDYKVYNETLKDGFNAFLKYYNYEYNPLDSVITFDYPLLCRIHGYDGIELFYKYISYIKIENSFCQCFDCKLIQDILNCYNKDYQFYFFNISQLLLNQMILSAIVSQDIVIFNKLILKKIYKALNKKSKLEIYNLIVNIYYECMNRLEMSDQKVVQYFYQGLSSLSSMIYYGCLYKNLEQELSYVESHNK